MSIKNNITLRSVFFLLATIASSAQAQKINSSVASKFDSIFSKEFSKNEPGAAVLVMKGETKIFEKGYGIADIETKEKITTNTVFNTGSITKTFVANGILILQEQGLLSLEDSLYKFFPDFDNKEIAQKVKIKHLLSHTSGLQDLRKIKEKSEFYLTAKDTANFEPIKRNTKLHFEPGEKFKYSNPAYNGLALIIEQLTNQKWQKFIIDSVFTPSKMSLSKITDGNMPNKDVAHGYNKDNANTYKEFDYGEVPTFAASGNGGIWSSVNELANYEIALRKNIFLSKKTIDESRKTFKPKHWNDSTDPFIGYSWFIGKEGLRINMTTEFNSTIISHTGSQGGFMSFFISIPKEEVVYIMLSNRPVKNFRTLIKEGLLILKKQGLIN